jgi:hypothetical protein
MMCVTKAMSGIDNTEKLSLVTTFKLVLQARFNLHLAAPNKAENQKILYDLCKITFSAI